MANGLASEMAKPGTANEIGREGDSPALQLLPQMQASIAHGPSSVPSRAQEAVAYADSVAEYQGHTSMELAAVIGFKLAICCLIVFAATRIRHATF